MNLFFKFLDALIYAFGTSVLLIVIGGGLVLLYGAVRERWSR